MDDEYEEIRQVTTKEQNPPFMRGRYAVGMSMENKLNLFIDLLFLLTVLLLNSHLAENSANERHLVIIYTM